MPTLKKKSRSRSRETEHEEDSPKKSRRGKKTTGKGWGAVAARKQEVDEAKEAAERTRIPKFWIKDGETSNIQFLEDEPYAMDGFNVKVKGNWTFLPTQLTAQKYCLLMDSGRKPSWKAAFKILDFRGSWDKDKKEFKYDGPVEKLYLVSHTVTQQLHQFSERKKKNLSELVIEITRTGSGKDSTYNIGVAYDDEDDRMEPVEWETETPPVEELCQPPNDNSLRRWGLVDGDVDDDAAEDDLPF